MAYSNLTGINIAIDRGGTFCDVIARIPGRPDHVFKLLSVDPENYPDAPTEGIRRVLEHAHGVTIAPGQKLHLDSIDLIRMGTTVATNALLERKGADVVLVTTKGFGDVLRIGNQTRPAIFDLTARKLGHLYLHVVEVDERVTMEAFTEGGGDKLQIDVDSDESLRVGVTGDIVRVIKEPDIKIVRKQLELVYAQGVRAVAVCLLHGYAYPEHEAKIAAVAKDLGFSVSVSHVLQPMVGMVSRSSSTVADAYLSPVVSEYIQGFGRGFEGGLEAFGNKLLFMQSNGGLCPWYAFTGLRAILSGPAGGMVGYGETCYDDETETAVIGFDAGGTSTDVSRYAGSLEHIYETVVSQVSLQTPQLDIATVAAGGGSMLFWKNGMFAVGPESAGSDPGPACYRKGGPLTVTDANLFLGRLVPQYFPKIFGPSHNEPLDAETTQMKFAELTEQINAAGTTYTPEEVAAGFLRVAVESMARPIRNMTEAKGHAVAEHTLACFGGSGGQFSVALAKSLGIQHVAVHKYLSLLSAYGIALADIRIEHQAPISVTYGPDTLGAINAKAEELFQAALAEYTKQGHSGSTRVETWLNMRYVGSDTHLLIPKEDNAEELFIERHRREFGFALDRRVLVDDIEVVLIVQSRGRGSRNPYREYRELKASTQGVSPQNVTPQGTTKVYFDKWYECKVYELDALSIGTIVAAPSVILDNTQTILVEPGCSAAILTEHVLLDVDQVPRADLSDETVDPIQLSVFGHRFMLVAEQMGRTLQQTAISTNIKERLDFSCAVFDCNGDLVANAPHVPIHLGAMSFAVKAQKDLWEGRLEEGDVLVTNHPCAGGSHLPDITVITPVIENGEVLFWTASRGHHADIGSISAGSMPSNLKSIYDEGAAIVSHKLFSKGVFDEEGITRLLLEEPAKYPGGSGTRALGDNISDLKAQASANFKGISLLRALVAQYTFPVIDLYMRAIQDTAELAVRNLLRTAYLRFSGHDLLAIDYLDDGTPISVYITIDSDSGDAVFDFSESGDEIYGNLNAPKAILYLAVLYVMRSLISDDIPLNNGCLKPIKFLTRDGSVVDPSEEAAVVGGNVETSQRIVDVMLKAFAAAAALQGTCNNFTFGTTDPNGISFGYYETICGGAGAGPTWDGQSAVQCHTTNTRITDTELFEKRYPVIVREYSIRTGSGGCGVHRGGDGVIRDIEFTYDLQVSCLMERRSLAPFGLAGGGSGARGRNVWIRRPKEGLEPKRAYLGGKTTVRVSKGDRVIIMTPGGGGYGKEEVDDDDNEKGVEYGVTSTTPSRATGSVAMRTMIQETN